MKTNHDARVDRYIENAPEFAQPILRHLRKLAHKAEPEITEEIKWSVPHFVLNGIVFNMAAFKQHCSLNFWKGSTVVPEGARKETGMGQFGRITSVKDLPPDEEIIGYICKAVAINREKSTGTPKKKLTPTRNLPLEVPEDLQQQLTLNKAAGDVFNKFSPSKRKEYIEWITGAKQAATRARRVATAVEWMAEGKSRHWKYQR